MGGRLAHFAEKWEEITDNKWVLSIVRNGFRIPFIKIPPLSSVPIRMSQSSSPFLREEIKNLLNKRAVERVQNPGPASVAELDAPSDWRPGGRGFNPHRGRQHSFVEIDHEIFSTVILSLPLIQEGQLSVSGERMCTILVNRLEDQACPVNVWLGKLTALDMTPLG